MEKAESDVDVLVIGDLPFAELVDAFASAQESIGREVSPSVYLVEESMTKAPERPSFRYFTRPSAENIPHWRPGCLWMIG
jgi:hypothetical protein